MHRTVCSSPGGNQKAGRAGREGLGQLSDGCMDMLAWWSLDGPQDSGKCCGNPLGGGNSELCFIYPKHQNPQGDIELEQAFWIVFSNLLNLKVG